MRTFQIMNHLTLWKHCLLFIQYLPFLKELKYGIKIELWHDHWVFVALSCICRQGYSNWITDYSNKTTATILKLVEPLLKQGQTLWTDIFYNSPCLAKRVKIVNKIVLVHRNWNKIKCFKNSDRHKTEKRHNNNTAFWACVSQFGVTRSFNKQASTFWERRKTTDKICCVSDARRMKCYNVKRVTEDSVWNVLKTTTSSLNSMVIKYYYSIILTSLLC